MKDVCRRNGILYLDPPKLEETDFVDGVHPNALGHEKIFNNVIVFFEQNSWI